jgi:ribosomal protein L30E
VWVEESLKNNPD